MLLSSFGSEEECREFSSREGITSDLVLIFSDEDMEIGYAFLNPTMDNEWYLEN